MEYEERKTMGLCARITAWVAGSFVAMLLLFLAFFHYGLNAVYIDDLDSMLRIWGGQVIHGEAGSEGFSPPVGELVPGLSLGFLLENRGRPLGWDVVGSVPEGGRRFIADAPDLMEDARLKGYSKGRTLAFSGAFFRVMAFASKGGRSVGLAMAPVDVFPEGRIGFQWLFCLFGILSFFMVIVGVYRYTWGLIRSIDMLRVASEKIAEGDLSQGVEVTRNSAFVSLFESINRIRCGIIEKIRESEIQNRALMDNGEELEASNRELERAIFKANEMMAEAEIRSYELEHEVVQRRQAEEALRSNEEKYRAIVENMKEGYCEVSQGGYVVFVNASMCEITGYAVDEIIGMHRGEFIAVESRQRVLASFSDLFNGVEDIADFDYPILRKDGSRRHIGVSVSLIRDTSGARTGFRTIVRDVEARKRYEEELIYMAYHDPLTGLKNRKGFYERLENDITRAKRYGGRVALLYIDIDRFKEVNDTLGHEGGDMVLQEITRRFLDNLRQSDCVARMGGDEFAVILENDGGCDVVAEKMVEILSHPYEVGGQVVDYVSGSIGIALFPDDAVTANDLICYADSDMYAVKRKRKCRDSCCVEKKGGTV